MSVAGAAAAGMLSSSLRTALATKPRGGSVFSIKHVVVLMQENRSFDHYFGSLPGVRGFDDPTATCLCDGRSVFSQLDPTSGTTVSPHPVDSMHPRDLDHGWEGTHSAWNQGNYDGWVRAKGAASMSYLTRADIPFHYALADAFTVCDNYFCSVMGPTNPNRLYLWSGSIDPQGRAGGPVTDNRTSGFRWTTYPERLQSAGVSWKVYQNARDNFDDNALAWFKLYRDASPGTALYERGMASVPSGSGTTAGDIVAAIKRDVLSDSLPVVSWIVPPEECSEHPSCSPAAGARFIAQVIEALTADPGVWASTVLLINYDENDGFFDHVPPPVPPAGTHDEFIGGQPIGLGPRVPMFVVSPWSRGGYVCPQVFDHTSVIRLLEVLTGIAEPNISAWRRKVCGDLTSAFDFTNAVVAFPDLPDMHLGESAQDATGGAPTQWQRPVRPSPVQPDATARLDAASSKVHIELSNTGTESAHFAVRVDGERHPRHYDVDAYGGSVEDSVEIQGSHCSVEITAYGVAGMIRKFAGTIANGDDTDERAANTSKTKCIDSIA